VGLEFELRAFFTYKAGASSIEPHLQFILLWLFWRWGLAKYFPGLVFIFPILSSQVRITGMSHWHQA
jgi:hypothetical protein